MTDKELRFQCAKIASELVGALGIDEVERVAKRLYEWIIGAGGR